MPALRRLTAALGIAVLVSMAFAAVGNAANYRYWGFFQQTDGAWTMATIGAAQAIPEHGAVDGWRYAVVGDETVREPRTDLTFEDICPDAVAAEGSKVVAVVVDSGTSDDSPDGGDVPGAFAGCAEVAADATSMDALAAVADVVEEGGFVCTIGDYPQSGCDPNEVPGDAPTDDGSTVDVAVPGAAGQTSDDAGTDDATDDPVDDDAAAASDDSDDSADSGSGNAAIVIVAVVVVVALAVTAVIRARRRSDQS